MKTVLLCGGKGTRLREKTESIPKPLVEIGGYPILWHIMKMYSHHGFHDFVLCLGYLSDRIKDYFVDLASYKTRDFQLETNAGGDPKITPLSAARDDWNIIFAETGEETMTGGRIRRIEKYIDDDLFFVTYGDGVSDIDVNELLKFHKSHGRMATVTVTLPRTSFGMLNITDDNVVTGFREKPKIESFVNCGFFVFNRKIFDYMSGDESVLERDVLPKIAEEGQLMAYRHRGFWDCMDTYKDNVTLNEQWAKGTAPWKLWSE